MYSDLADITAESRIRVRIIQLFKKSSYPGSSKFAKGALELVLIDDKGTRIEAQVRSYLIWKWANILKEFACIIVSGFGLIQSRGSFRFSRHINKISFLPGTIVTSCEINTIPRYGFQFQDFATILAHNLEPHFLIDVIGELIEYGDVQSLTRGDIVRQMLSIKLADHSNGRVIVILQFAKLGMFHDEIYISNAFFGTRLLLDQSLPEIIEYKLRDAEMVGEHGSRSISHVSGHLIQDVSMNFLQPGSKKLLSQIQGDVDTGVYVTLATIVDIEDKNNWFYNSCKKCKKAVETDGENFYCLHCEKQLDFPVPRYRVQVKVSDDTGYASFVMFDNDVMSIIHKSVTTLRDELHQGGNVDAFPDLLNVMLNKTYLFRYEISGKVFSSKGNKTHTIKKMIDDQDIIKQFKSGTIAVEVTSEFAESGSNVDEKDGEVNLITPRKQNVADVCVAEQESMSGTYLLKSVNKGKMIVDAYHVSSFNDAILSSEVNQSKAVGRGIVINKGTASLEIVPPKTFASEMVTPKKRSVETIEVIDEETEEIILQSPKLLKPVKIEKLDG